MSSLSTAFKVHYTQKLGDPSGHLGGTHHGLWGLDAPDYSSSKYNIIHSNFVNTKCL